MDRRRYLALCAGTLPLAGCTGGPGDPITVLAVNEDGSAHTVTAWVVRGERLVVANTVEVASGAVERLGQTPWRRGRYRVTVQVDGAPVLAREFQSEEWFNQLDVFLAEVGHRPEDENRGTPGEA